MNQFDIKNMSANDPRKTHETKVMISGKPRDSTSIGRKMQPNASFTEPNFFGSSVITGIGSILKARLVQMQDQFKVAMDKIETEEKNLETLKIKKTKLRNKLIEIYQFLLKNPNIILYS